jgi:hypothetical protein
VTECSPGPWVTVYNGGGLCGVRDANRNWITYIAGEDLRLRRQEANARLIAAAPDLRDELTMLCNILDGCGIELPPEVEATGEGA